MTVARISTCVIGFLFVRQNKALRKISDVEL